MKIVQSINKIYQDQLSLNKLLSKKADKIMASIKKPHWHFESRLKSLESFALKIESGRYVQPERLEDFYATTIVVKDHSEIKVAISLVKAHFNIYSRRPKSNNITPLNSDSFIFNDLRLYLKLKTTTSIPPGPIHDVIFELQIKTFLQHAWSVATHDLIYKSDEINWVKQRVAYQVKALLENAESAIGRAGKMTKVEMNSITNDKIKYQNLVKDFLHSKFTVEKLPKHMTTLTQNVISLLKNLKVEINDLSKSIDNETALGRGVKTLNLSPYLIIVQCLINQDPQKVQNYLNKDKDFKILMPSEIDSSLLSGAVRGPNSIQIGNAN